MFWERVFVHIWATSWENLLLPCANNKCADQPAHPRSLISAFVVRCLDSIILLVSISEIRSLYLASVAAQAGLSIPTRENPKTGFLMAGLNYSKTAIELNDRSYETASAQRILPLRTNSDMQLVKLVQSLLWRFSGFSLFCYLPLTNSGK